MGSRGPLSISSKTPVKINQHGVTECVDLIISALFASICVFQMCAREDMFSKGEILDQVLQIKENLEDIVSREVNKATRNLEKKFDALLAKLGEKK